MIFTLSKLLYRGSKFFIELDFNGVLCKKVFTHQTYKTDI